jgi:hypothetical protein
VSNYQREHIVLLLQTSIEIVTRNSNRNCIFILFSSCREVVNNLKESLRFMQIFSPPMAMLEAFAGALYFLMLQGNGSGHTSFLPASALCVAAVQAGYPFDRFAFLQYARNECGCLVKSVDKLGPDIIFHCADICWKQ